MALVIGAALRFDGIIGRELDYDEAATGYFGSVPFAELWDAHARLEPNPPLFYTLAWLVQHADGSVEQIRTVSAAASLGSILVAWLLTRRMAGEFAANAAAWLLATSAIEIVIGQYARTYAVLTLLLLVAWLSLVAADQTGKRLWWLGYLVAASAALYAHHTAAVTLFVLNASLLACAVARRPIARPFVAGLLVTNAVVAVIYAPWLPVLLHQLQPHETLVVMVRRTTSAFAALPSLVSDRFQFQQQSWFDRRLLPLVALVGWRLRGSPHLLAAVAFGSLVPLALVLVSHWHPLLNGKTLAASGTVLLVISAIGLSVLGRVRLLALAVVVACQLSIDVGLRARPEEGWREVAQTLGAHAIADDVIYVNQQAMVLPLQRYGWPESRLILRSYANPREEPWYRGFPGQLVAPAGVAAATAPTRRVWLLVRNASAADGEIESVLTNGRSVMLRDATKALSLTLFASY